MENQQMDEVLRYLYQMSSTSAGREEIMQNVFKNEPTIPIDAILLHLKDKRCIFNPIRVDNNIAYDMSDHYALTVTGMEFLRNASIPGKPFEAQEMERLLEVEKQAITAKLAKNENFPKQQWMVLPLITFAFGIISTIGAEFLKRQFFPDPKPNPQIIVVHDTIRTSLQQAVKH
jgi:hypothetical protein